jgi:CheY-like chemotaxis protein
MPDLRYEKIQALIVDDFDNFRVMLFNMLQELGIPKVDMASSDKEALRLCAINTYDIILCDQNLGGGKSGQQILEVLRHTPNLNSDSIFVVISAAANKSIIMAAFDYEPDDYLTKPITPRTLEQRLNRLLTQRLLLAPIYAAIKEPNINLAIDLCRREISGVNRYSNHCQKLLGYLLLEAERFSEAENLYR